MEGIGRAGVTVGAFIFLTHLVHLSEGQVREDGDTIIARSPRAAEKLPVHRKLLHDSPYPSYSV